MTVKKSDLWDPEFGVISPWVYPPRQRPRSRLRPKLLDVIVVIAIIGILAGLILPGFPQDRTPVLPPKSGRAIDPEIAKIAGNYYQGNGLGRRWHLELTSDGRYSFVSSGCVGVHEKDCGYLHFAKGKIHLFPAKPSLKPGPEGETWLTWIPSGLRIVRWGTRIYLIPDEKAQDFCEAIGEGREPRTKSRGRFFLSEVLSDADLEKPVEGLPNVPESWKAMLPVKSKIEAE